MAASTGRYRPLPSGAHKLDPAAVREDQAERLRRATVELIVAKGYPAVRIADLARLSRVSQPTFYSLFASKEELLISAYDEIAGRAVKGVLEGYEAPVPHPERLRRAIGAFAEMAASEPDEISLVLLGALGAGQTALAARGRNVGVMEERIRVVRYELAQAPDGDGAGSATAEEQAADLTAKVIIGGTREVIANRVSRGLAAELPDLVGELAAWAGAFPLRLPPEVAAARGRPMRGLTGESAKVAERARAIDGPLRSGRSALGRGEVLNSQRARIVDAVAAAVAEKGLAALTIPEIVSRANVSNETFYSIYPSKHHAFVGAQKVGMRQALRVADAAYRRRLPDWPSAVATGLRALIDYLVTEPAHAHLSIVDTLGASPETIEIRQQTLAAFASYFTPGYELGAPSASPIAAEAVVGSCWQVLHHFADAGRLDELPALTPQITFLALAPFLGARDAAEQAVAAAALR